VTAGRIFFRSLFPYDLIGLTMFQKLIEFVLKSKFIVLSVIVGLVLWGSFSLQNLPIDAVPDITNNQVVLITQSPTLATQEVEKYVTAPIELQLANISGVEQIRSISRQGLSVITLIFKEEVPAYQARQVVTEQLKVVERDIPQGFGTPTLAPMTTGLGEIFQYTLEIDSAYREKYDLTTLRTLQDWQIKRQLAGIEGVVEVSSFGGFVKQYEVAVQLDKLQRYGISLETLVSAVQKSNANIGASYIERANQAFFIRGEGALESLSDLENVVVRQEGVPILVKDVAEVQFGSANRFGAMTKNGEGETVGGIVLMLKGADSEATIGGVKERIKQIEKTLPKGVHINPFIDRTKLIENSIRTVAMNLAEGGLIVVFVLVILLGSIRAGLLVASVIPITMLITFAIMRVSGISANLMSLGAIDFGLLVDGSVIVVEAVLFQLHLPTNKERIPISLMNALVRDSAKKVISSAIFGGIIILLVYLPILSLTGIEGKMFRPMAQTVSIALVVSLFLSITYVPIVSTLFLRGEGQHQLAFSEKLVHQLHTWYEPLLRRGLEAKKWFIGIAVTLFLGSLALFQTLGGEFIPTLDEGDMAIDFQTPPGASLQTTIDATLRAQKVLLAHFPEIKQIVGRIGASEIPTDPMPPEMSDLMMNMEPRSSWTSAKTKEELIEKMRALLEEEVPGTSIEFTQPIQMRFNEMIAGSKSELVIKIFGEDLDTLAVLASRVEKSILKIEGVSSSKVERVTGLPQIRVRYNRVALARYGLQVESLNQTLKTAFAGETVGVLFEDQKRFDVVVRLEESFRKSEMDIQNIWVPLSDGQQIKLAELATIERVKGPAQVSREGTNRRINIGVGVAGRDVESLVEELKLTLEKEVPLPMGYYYAYGGAFENLQAAKDRLLIAVPIALALIFLMLYLNFQSLIRSLLIFSSIPLATIGGTTALWIRGMPFSISAGIGYIALFGIVVLNGIVLLSYLNDLEKEKDLSIRARVLEGVRVRFRPVLITATVASLGFLPMAISTSAGAEVQKPLATVVIGGLISATLLTLLILPILYEITAAKNEQIKD
jgi:cobalt-zinc-cadmium resistance protein CzcA